MNREMMIITVGAGLLTLISAAILLLSWMSSKNAVVERRLLSAGGVGEQNRTSRKFSKSLTKLIAGLGATLAKSGLLPAATIAELEEMLSTASLGDRNALAMFLGAKMLLACSFLILGIAVTHNLPVTPALHFGLPALAMLAGLLLPDYVIGQMRKTYLTGVATGLPDALDMMVICAEAGLGLEPALERVGRELENTSPAMAAELEITSREFQLISDRRQVLINMGQRTKIEGLRRLGSTLIQTMEFGTPLTQALRTLAGEMRQEHMIRFEGRAAKLPVLLTLPMILFILPCVFIVVGGPAALRVMNVLAH